MDCNKDSTCAHSFYGKNAYSMCNNHNNLSAYVILTNTDASYYSLSVIYILDVMKLAIYTADYKTMNVFIGRHMDLYTSVQLLYILLYIYSALIAHTCAAFYTPPEINIRTPTIRFKITIDVYFLFIQVYSDFYLSCTNDLSLSQFSGVYVF